MNDRESICEFQHSGVDNYDSPIYAVDDRGDSDNTVTVTNCVYGEKIVAD